MKKPYHPTGEPIVATLSNGDSNPKLIHRIDNSHATVRSIHIGFANAIIRLRVARLCEVCWKKKPDWLHEDLQDVEVSL